MKHPVKLYITVFLLWFIARGTQCGDKYEDNCGSYTTDTAYLSIDLTNNAPVYHVHDSIKFYSKISDNIQPQSGNAFVHALNSLSAHIQAYKVIPTGSSYQMNYANNEFNPYVNIGIFDNTSGSENRILFQRVVPFNTLDGGYVCGDTGLYVIVINLSNDGPENMQFYVGNDHCTVYKGYSSIPEVKQNKQYWDSVGITTLTLANSNNYGILVNKPEKNYFFVNVVP